MNRRAEAKEKTRQKAIREARKAFAVTDYHTVSIRDLAKAMKMSTGAIFGNFVSKADLWSAVMPLPVPSDTAVTRLAPDLLEATIRAFYGEVGLNLASAVEANGWKWIDTAPRHVSVLAESLRSLIELATSPLDGDAWARHLAAKAGVDAPRFPSPQAASLAPSDDAAAQA